MRRKKDYLKYKKTIKRKIKKFSKRSQLELSIEGKQVLDTAVKAWISRIKFLSKKYYSIRAEIRYFKPHKKRLRKNFKKSNAYKLRYL